jgi:hypothetical protein
LTDLGTLSITRDWASRPALSPMPTALNWQLSATRQAVPAPSRCHRPGEALALPRGSPAAMPPSP